MCIILDHFNYRKCKSLQKNLLKNRMKKITNLLLITLFIASCCTDESVETARYELSTAELSLIPYKSGEKISFVHSNGYTFDFKVIEDTTQWMQYFDFCEWNCCGQDYFSYQVKTAVLESVYPKFQFEFSLGTSIYSEYSPGILNIQLNYSRSVQFPYDSSATIICDTLSKTVFHDSIYLNDKLFFNVFEKDFETYNYFSDSSVLSPKTLYYNNQGLIQFKMSNNETYTINK